MVYQKCLKTPRLLRTLTLFLTEGQPRTPQLIEIESQIRKAIRDAVNRKTRKPFQWGGLTGYQQLEVIAKGLHQIIADDPENSYLRQVSKRVDRTVAKLPKHQAYVEHYCKSAR